MGQFKFAAAMKGEATVYGAQRPSHPAQAVDATLVSEWISFMKQNGVRRVCCLLAPKQLAYDRLDLLGTYREVFGESNVCHAAIEDDHFCDAATLEDSILPCWSASILGNSPPASMLARFVPCSCWQKRTAFNPIYPPGSYKPARGWVYITHPRQ